jgi:hypothetical protein
MRVLAFTLLFVGVGIIMFYGNRAMFDHLALARIQHEEKVKACNRGGAIYADGVCQHPFAPICRRTLDCPPYPRRL